MVKQPLSQVSLFSDLSDEELSAISARATTKTFPKNAILINEGDDTSSLYFIISGSAKVYSSDEDGNEIVLAVLGPNEYFGELALIDEEPRSASVMTMEAARMILISRTDFLDCLNKHASISLSLLKALSRKLRRQTESTKSLVLLGVYERLVRLLRELAVEQNGQLTVQGVSHKDLAERIYASREMVTMIIKELKIGDYIEADRKRIVIKKTLPAKW